MKKLENLYLRLPVALQNAVVSIEGWRINRRRYGGGFRHAERLVQEQSSLTVAELQLLRGRLLRSFFQNASAVPFWQQQFKVFSVNPESDEPFNELAKLPVLTKEEVKRNFEGIINPAIRQRSRLWRHTSGTTGSGLIFPEISSTEHFTWAFWWRYRRWHGLTPGMRCGYFGGRSLMAVSSRFPPFWRLNRPSNQLMFSGYHLSRESAPSYILALRKYDVQWLHGYPSMLSLLANYVIADSLEVNLPSLMCITTGAESLSARQRNIIRMAFNVPVVQHYGQTEAAANISECEHGQLHIDEDFSAAEMVTNPHDVGSQRLLGTNWLNPAFPLFRYDTGDIVVESQGICRCGRAGRLIDSIDGRKEDYLLLPNGTRIGRLDHILKDMVNVNEAQFFQNDPRFVTVRVVRGAAYCDSDEKQLRHEIRQRIGSEIDVRIDYLEAIQRGPNGKLRLVVSGLPLL